jgi:hypothetical protein
MSPLASAAEEETVSNVSTVADGLGIRAEMGRGNLFE